eukprot:124718_1
MATLNTETDELSSSSSSNINDMNQFINQTNNFSRPWDGLNIEYFVSIDYGSCGYKAAFSPTNAPSYQRLIQDWSESRLSSALTQNLASLLIDKVTKETVAIGYEAETLYAKQKQQDKYMYFEQFKHYLYSNDKAKNNIVVSDADGKSTLNLPNLITKSLVAIMKHSLQQINNLALLGGFDNVIHDQIFWVLCIPAVWDESSRELMENCMKQSGMKHYELALEPIVSICHILTMQKNNDFKSNDKILVLDCGGSTVDAACVKFDSKSIDESALSYCDSIMVGGRNVDQEFLKLFNQLLPKDVIETIKISHPIQWLKQKEEFQWSKFSCPVELSDTWNVAFSIGIKNALNKKRKKEKTAYKSITSYVEKYEIIDYSKLPHQKICGAFKISRASLKISSAGWFYLYEQVVQKLVTFVANVLKNKNAVGCDKVIVTGGFANTEYVTSRLLKEFPNKTFHLSRFRHLSVVKGALYWICQTAKFTKLDIKYSRGNSIAKYIINENKNEN